MCFRAKASATSDTNKMDKCEEIKKRKRPKSCKECYSRWDKRVAGIVGLITFFAIIGILIFNSFDTTTNARKLLYKRSLKNEKCTAGGDCTITCRSIMSTDDIVHEINTALSPQTCSTIKQLNFNEMHFLANNTIPENWLSELSVKVNNLEISGSNINNIDDGAFSSNSLNTLTNLAIRRCKVTNFRKNMFEGMKSLTYLWIEYTENTDISIEKDLLYHIDMLVTLHCTYCILSSENLQNLLSIYMSDLKTLEFRSSQIKSLKAGIFDNVPSVEQIYLTGIGLRLLELGTFRRLTRLTKLHLESNSLMTLPEGIFDDMLRNSNTKIALSNNPFTCDCNLKWLQDFYLEGSYIDRENPPTCINGISFENGDFCPTTATTSETSATTYTTTSSSTTEISTSPTTERYKKRTVECTENAFYENEERETELFQTQNLIVFEEIFNLSFLTTNEHPVRIEVEIKSSADLSYFHMLWFNSFNPSDEGCVAHLEPKVLLENLEYDNTYTVCLMYNTELTVAPHDCFGLTIPAEQSERAWIKYKTKSTIIISLVCVIIAIMIASMCMMYCCVRHHPKLIKGNNRVIIIGKQKPNPQSLVPDYKGPVYVAPSIESYNTAPASYISTSNIYSRVKERTNRVPLDSIHEQEAEMGYVSPTGTLGSNANGLKRQNMNIPRPILQSPYNEDYIYESVPPALPPPNQCHKSIKILANSDEKLYTTA